MNISEPQLKVGEADHENVIQAFKEWRAKEPSISEAIARRHNHIRPSVTRRIFRTIALGFIAASIALTAVVWQSDSQEMGRTVSALQAWFINSLPLGRRPSVTPIGSITAATDNSAPSRGTAPLVTSQPAEEKLNSIKRQIDAVTNQLTEVRRIAEQLAANQQNMVEDIAALKANEESINKRLLAASSHLPNTFALPKKKPQEPRLGVTGRSSNERPSGGEPLPLH